MTYAGAATHIVIASGSRPAAAAASRTVAMLQAVMSGSASWRMKPSPTSPASVERVRPVPGDPDIAAGCPGSTGSAPSVPLYSTLRPLASSRITSIEARKSASLTGLPLIARTAESPRPMPQTVRLPYISFSVANRDAITVQSRVAGLVTIGPTISLWVAVEDPAVDHERLFPQQVGVERPRVAEPVGLGPPRQLDHPRTPAGWSAGRRRSSRLPHRPERPVASTRSTVRP